MAAQDQSIVFLSNQLAWHPTIIGRDGSIMGVSEFLPSESAEEIDKTITAFLKAIEVQGADTLATLNRELANLRAEAGRLSDSLRQSRSTQEAVQYGARLKQLILLLRILESHYRNLFPKRTGTLGD